MRQSTSDPMFVLSANANNACLVEAIYSSSPVSFAGIFVLFILVLYRLDWNFRESILELIGLRGMKNISILEMFVMAATFGATFYALFEVLKTCNP
ncbi:hypothetical protein Q5Y75_20240 [Ruegeria sp. 2205SS24-7]|uniref:hypothetical protein n=1 Tax=Ruegeria discodermiae TaxID=3064389 RepID=UPI002742776A|nr:hypothetical protein [Ruegeria sp. 2205SS24-7]MDP5219557.1 hypothetical protein [Ruegeria sp. 2205SS24-7]